MMIRKGITVVMLALLLTAGCASRNDWKINSEYEKSLQNHQLEQTLQIRHKANAIKNTMVYECDDGTEACGVAKAMSKMVAAGHIASLEALPYKGTRPTTGVDVQKDIGGFTGQLITGAMTLGIVRFVTDSQPTTEYNNAGNVSSSGNRTDSHTTTLGDNNEGQGSRADASGSDVDGGQQQDNSTNE